MSQHVDWIVYSLGDGLCQYQPEQRIAALAQAASISITTAGTAIDSAFVECCDSGVYDLEDMLDQLRQRLQADLTHAHLMGLWSLAYQPDIEIIKHAQAQYTRSRTALLCNGSPLLEEALAAYLPEVDQLVSQAFYSHAFGRLDTDPALFAAVGSRLSSPAANLLYISNKATARAAATQAGWQARTVNSINSI